MNKKTIALDRVIQKVNELSLDDVKKVETFIDKLQEGDNKTFGETVTKLSEPVFTKVWDNQEDSVYDNL